MTFKYIITIDGCLLFSPTLSHDTVARGMTVTSAGFVRITATYPGVLDVHCYGRSESLDIDSKPDDAVNIRIWGGLVP